MRTSDAGESFVLCKHGWVRVDDWDGTPRLHEFRSLEARRLIPYLSLRHGWADILMPIALTGALLLTLLVLIWDHFLAVLGLFSRRAKRRHRRLQKEVTKLWSYPMVKFEVAVVANLSFVGVVTLVAITPAKTPHKNALDLPDLTNRPLSNWEIVMYIYALGPSLYPAYSTLEYPFVWVKGY